MSFKVNSQQSIKLEKNISNYNSGVNSGIRYQGDPGEKTRGSNGGGDSTSSVCSQDLRNVCGVPFKYAGV